MTAERPTTGAEGFHLGPALRRAWLGYQQRLDEGLAAAGFPDRGFPDGRVLRLCRDAGETTVSDIGRQLEITRQGAGKIVANLVSKGFVTALPSSTDRRENIVSLTPMALNYLEAQRKTAQAIARDVQAELGDDGLHGLRQLLDLLGGAEEVRLRPYLRKMRRLGGWRDPD